MRISDWSSDVCSSDLLAANADAMLEWRARAMEADLIVYPELQLIGYPPEDLVLKPALVDRANHELDRLAQATAAGGPAMLVGTVVAPTDRKRGVWGKHVSVRVDLRG